MEAWVRRRPERDGCQGGQKKKRGQGLTLAGPLFELLSLPLKDVDAKALRAWVHRQNERGAAQARRALQMFSGFLRWCQSTEKYEDIVTTNPARDPKVVAALRPPGKRRVDKLEKVHLQAWFEAVLGLPNRAMSAYLIALLLTGARREEMAALKWPHINFRYTRMRIADKVEETRDIPIGPYLTQLLSGLPRIPKNEFVFVSPTAASGHVEDSRSSMDVAIEHAGLDHLTPHGLRRSFGVLAEAAGVPEGAINQIMGHVPNGSGEDYKPRTVDELRRFMCEAERHIVEWAGLDFAFSSER